MDVQSAPFSAVCEDQKTLRGEVQLSIGLRFGQGGDLYEVNETLSDERYRNQASAVAYCYSQSAKEVQGRSDSTVAYFS